MAEPDKTSRLSAEDYLELEGRESSVRHEYVRGKIFAMTGATDAHNIICGNLFVALHAFIRGSGCFVYINDMKVRIEVADSFYYPDIMVTCESFNAKSVFKQSPRLIVEVLSPSTKQIDRREKLVAYQQLSSLMQYVVVYQNRMLIEVNQRNPEGEFELTRLTGSDVLRLKALPENTLSIAVSTSYEGLELPPFVEESEEEYELA
ncbi:MAG: Uma2 family endonuclease [Candidatus Melainabacteria bacterium]|nr:Uma2 family endonuclease [Candidatus Melainabacteria bacterium]